MRTVLAPLKLEGVGTSEVESLVSYVLRLAHTHGVSTHQIGKVLLNDVPYLHSDEGPKLASGSLSYAMLCSFSPQAAQMIHRLGRLTGQDNLVHGTLLRFGNNLCGNHTGVLLEYRRWCPLCYSRPLQHTYEPLAWSLPMVTRCPVHRVRLIERCLHCGARQLAWVGGSDRRACSRCRRSLAGAEDQQNALGHWSGWCESEMLKLLEHAATPGTPDFIDDAYKEFANGIEQLEHEGIRFPEGIATLRKDIAKGRVVRPRMKTLFKVAAVCGTTPTDVLLHPREAAAVLLFPDEVTTPRAPPKNKFRSENYRRCEESIRELMTLPNDVLLPAVGGLCEKHGISTSNFWETRRDLWKTYSVERKLRVKDQAEYRLSLAMSYATTAIQRARGVGVRIHQKKTIARMQCEVGVSKRMARSALRVALMQTRMDKRAQSA